MKLSLFPILILCLFLPVSLFAENPWTYSLGVSGIDYTWIDKDSGVILQEQMIGLDIRGASMMNLTGFYYGSFISIARPMIYWEYDNLNETSSMDYSRYDLYVAFGIPFGYRWQLPRSFNAVYLGVGPSMQSLFDFDNHLWGTGGIFWEFGFETLSTKKITLSIGGRMLIPIGSFITDGSSVAEGIDATSSVFFIGLSWTGNRGY